MGKSKTGSMPTLARGPLPTKIDGRKRGTLILTSPLEELAIATSHHGRHGVPRGCYESYE